MEDLFTIEEPPCKKTCKEPRDQSDLILIGANPQKPISVRDIPLTVTKAIKASLASGTEYAVLTLINNNAHGNIFLTAIKIRGMICIAGTYSNPPYPVMLRLCKLGTYETTGMLYTPENGNQLAAPNTTQLIDFAVGSVINNGSTGTGYHFELNLPAGKALKLQTNDALYLYINVDDIHSSQQVYYYGGVEYSYVMY